jgi:hypothetical protein
MLPVYEEVFMNCEAVKTRERLFQGMYSVEGIQGCIVWLQMEAGGVGGSMVASEAMTCQELLALSGALSAALPTGQLGLGSFFSSFSKGGKTQLRLLLSIIIR